MITETSVRHFLEQGAKQVRVFCGDEEGMTALRSQLQAADAAAAARVKYYIGDVTAPAYLDEAMSGADYVLYAPTIPYAHQCDEHPAEACTALLAPVNTVMQTAIQQKVQKIVVLVPIPETCNLNPATNSVSSLLVALMEKVVIAQARFQGQDSPTTICCARLEDDLNPEPRRSTSGRFAPAKNLKLIDYSFTNATNGDLLIQTADGIERIACENFDMKR